MSEWAVHTHALTRRYGALTAVDAVDLRVAAGEIYGFLGRNGAGKTTVIRMLLGLIRPDSGTAELLGQEVHRARSELWAQVGYLVEAPGLYPELTVADHFGLAARYRGLVTEDVELALARFDLGRYRDVRARALSLGTRQRLGLALALVHRPRLVLLDEPANSLDPAGVVDVRAMLRSLADAGVTVFMSSTPSVKSPASRTASASSTPADWSRSSPPSSFVPLRAADSSPTSASRSSPPAPRLLRSAGIDVAVEGSQVTSADPHVIAAPAQVATLLVEAGAPPCYLAVEREDLEQHFLRLTEAIP